MAAGDLRLPHAPVDGAVREGRVRRRRLSRSPSERLAAVAGTCGGLDTAQNFCARSNRREGVGRPARPTGRPGGSTGCSRGRRMSRRGSRARSRAEGASLIRRGRAEAVDAPEVVRIDHLSLAGDHEPPLERQPHRGATHFGEMRSPAEFVLAAAVGKGLGRVGRANGAARGLWAQSSTIRASRAGGEVGSVMPPSLGEQAANAVKTGSRAYALHRLPGGGLDRQASVSMRSMVLLITAKRSSSSTCALRQRPAGRDRLRISDEALVKHHDCGHRASNAMFFNAYRSEHVFACSMSSTA